MPWPLSTISSGSAPQARQQRSVLRRELAGADDRARARRDREFHLSANVCSRRCAPRTRSALPLAAHDVSFPHRDRWPRRRPRRPLLRRRTRAPARCSPFRKPDRPAAREARQDRLRRRGPAGREVARGAARSRVPAPSPPFHPVRNRVDSREHRWGGSWSIRLYTWLATPTCTIPPGAAGSATSSGPPLSPLHAPVR